MLHVIAKRCLLFAAAVGKYGYSSLGHSAALEQRLSERKIRLLQGLPGLRGVKRTVNLSGSMLFTLLSIHP